MSAPLVPEHRVLALTAFHVSIRVALGLSAVGAGAAGELTPAVRWPWVGALEPSRAVFLGAGAVVGLSLAAMPRSPA